MIPLPFLPRPSLVEVIGAARDRALARAPQAEWGLAHQGAAVLLTRDLGSGWLVRRAGRRLVALGRPLGAPAVRELAQTARARGLAPLLYKCDAATATSARREGWTVLRVGFEAVLDLGIWSSDRPACRQLRRKLRAARTQDITVEGARVLPFAAMAEVAQDWTHSHGRERGFSMGRFDPALLGRQQVLLGWHEGRLMAFASFHATASEWTLDLMRHRTGAPDGLMHSLVAEAAAMARAAGARRLSLAAIPDPAAGKSWMTAMGLGACGLAQFKRSFGPRLLPRFAAAPRPASLASGLAAVALAVHRPSPLSARVSGVRRPRSLISPLLPSGEPPHFGFEPIAMPCDARLEQPRTPAS
jgi:phosphatidylglycerol lysyltransferase